MKKLLDWLVSLFSVDVSEFVLDGKTYDLTQEEIEELKKYIEEKIK